MKAALRKILSKEEFTQRKMHLAFSRHYWRDALGIFMGQGMWAWEGHSELGRTNEAAVLAHLYRVTYYC